MVLVCKAMLRSIALQSSGGVGSGAGEGRLTGDLKSRLTPGGGNEGGRGVGRGVNVAGDCEGPEDEAAVQTCDPRPASAS